MIYENINLGSRKSQIAIGSRRSAPIARSLCPIPSVVRPSPPSRYSNELFLMSYVKQHVMHVSC